MEVTMKTVYSIFLLSEIIFYTQSQSGWQRMSFSYNTNIADIQFVNEFTGYFQQAEILHRAAFLNQLMGALHGTWFFRQVNL